MPELSATSSQENAPYTGSPSTNHRQLDAYHNIASTLFNHQDGEELEAEFLLAARNGDLNTVERILQRRNEDLLNVDVRDQETGNTAVIWAAKRGYVKIVALLLKHGADVTLRNYEGQTALEVASPQIQRQLLDGVDNGGPHRNLLQAAWQGNAALVQNILSETRRLDINCRNADGLTPLLLVARDLQLFEKLGGKVNGQYDPEQVVSQLLACRADPNAMDDEGRTALHYASSCKNPLAEGIIQLLLQQGSDVELRDRRCFTPIHWASQSGSVDVVNTLLNGGSDANARGYAGTTPLHISAINGHDQVASSLLDHGADVTLVDDSGLTAVDVAKTKKVKATLKQAWVNATQGRPERNLRPVRVASGEGTRKSADSTMSTLAPPNKRVCGQVILDEVEDYEEGGEISGEGPPVEPDSGPEPDFEPAPEWRRLSLPVSSDMSEAANVRLSQIHLSFSTSSFDTLTPRKAAMSVLQRQLTNAEKARKAEEQMIRSISRMSGMSPTPRSTVAAQRLAPLKSHTPRNRKEFKFGPGTKTHDGCRVSGTVNPQTGTRKCQSEPSRTYPSSSKECHIPVTILGLELDENLQDVARLKRLNQGPVGQFLSKKGHNRNGSDPSCPSPVPQLLPTEDPTLEDFYLKGRTASRTSLPHDYDLSAITSLSVSPPRGGLVMRIPSASDSRLKRRLPTTKEVDRYSSLRARTPTIEEERHSALRARTPIMEEDRQSALRPRTRSREERIDALRPTTPSVEDRRNVLRPTTPSIEDQRNILRPTTPTIEDRNNVMRTRTPTIEENQRFLVQSRASLDEDRHRNLHTRTPTIEDDRHGVLRTRTSDIEQIRLLSHSRTPVPCESANSCSRRVNPPMPILVQPADNEYAMDYATIDYSSSSSKESSPRLSYDSDCEQPPMVPPGGDIHQIRNKTVLRQGSFNIEATRVCNSNDSGLPEERNSVNCSFNSSSGSSGLGTPEGTDSGEAKPCKPRVRPKPLNRVQPNLSPTKSPGGGPVCRNMSGLPPGVSNNQQITGISVPHADRNSQQTNGTVNDTGQTSAKGLPMYSSYRIHSARRSQQNPDLSASFDASMSPVSQTPVVNIGTETPQQGSPSLSRNIETVRTSQSEARASYQPDGSPKKDKKSVINERPIVPPRKNKQKANVNNNVPVTKSDVRSSVSDSSTNCENNSSSSTSDNVKSPVRKPQTTTYVVKFGQSESPPSLPTRDGGVKRSSPTHSARNKSEKPAVPARPAGLKSKIPTPGSSPKKSPVDAPVIVTHPPTSDTPPGPSSEPLSDQASSQTPLLLNPFMSNQQPMLLKTDSLDSSHSETLTISSDPGTPPSHIDKAVTITICSSAEQTPVLNEGLENKQPKMPCVGKGEGNNKGNSASSVPGSGCQHNSRSPHSPRSPVSARSQTSQVSKSSACSKSGSVSKKSTSPKCARKVLPSGGASKKPSEHHGPVITDPFEAIRTQNTEQAVGSESSDKASRPRTCRDKPVPPPRKSTSKQVDAKKSRAKSSHLEVTSDAIGINHVTKKKGSGRGKKVRRIGEKALAGGKHDDKMAFVGGIGWQIKTNCNEDNTVRPARFVSLAASSSDEEEFAPVVPNYVYDLDDSKKSTTKRTRLTRVQLPGAITSKDSDSSDDDLFEGAEEVLEDEVIIVDRGDNHSPLNPEYTPRFPVISSQRKPTRDSIEFSEPSSNKKSVGKSANNLDIVWANEMNARARSPSPVMHAAPETADAITTFVKSVESSQKSDCISSAKTKNVSKVPTPSTPNKTPVKKNKPTKQVSVSGKGVQKVTPTGNCGKPSDAKKPPTSKSLQQSEEKKKESSEKPPPNQPTNNPLTDPAAMSTTAATSTPTTGQQSDSICSQGAKKQTINVPSQNNQKSPGAMTLPSAQKSPGPHTLAGGQKTSGVSVTNTKAASRKMPSSKPSSLPQKSDSAAKANAIVPPTTQKTSNADNSKMAASQVAVSPSDKTPRVPSQPQPSNQEPSIATSTSTASVRQSEDAVRSSKEQWNDGSPRRSLPSPHRSPKKQSPTGGSPRKSLDSSTVVRLFNQKKTDHSELKEEAELSAVIDEILKTTPHPSLSLHSQSGEDVQKKEKDVNNDLDDDLGVAGKSKAVSELPVTNAVENGSGRRTIEEAKQLQRLLSNFKHTPLTISHPPDDVSEWLESVSPGHKPPTSSRSNQGKPPVHPKPSAVTSSTEMMKGMEESVTSIYSRAEKSPRFIRKLDSWKDGQVKIPLDLDDDDDDDNEDAMSDCSLPLSDIMNDANSLASTLKDGDGAIVPPDGRIVTSRLGRRCSSRAASAMTNDSMSYDNVETIQWKKGNMLGKGAYGIVWCGLTNSGELIAVKEIELNTDDMEKAELEYEKIQEEVELLKTLRHENIVGYLGTSLDDSTVCIFMQFVPGGSIANYLARFGSLEEEVFCYYTKQILEGVEYLHMNNIIHRDIKGGNIMVMHNGVIKLIDFGCAKRLCLSVGALDSGHKRLLKSMRGTPYWMAPEVVKETGYGTKSDIWSIGCTVFEMASRKPPWADMTPMAAIFAIGSDKRVPQLPEKYSSDAKDFVNLCLTRDQGKRPSARELLSHAFILRKKKR